MKRAISRITQVLSNMLLLMFGLMLGGAALALDVPPAQEAPTPQFSTVYEFTATKRTQLKSVVEAIEQNQTLKEAGCKSATTSGKGHHSISYGCEKGSAAVIEEFQSALQPGVRLIVTTRTVLRLSGTSCPALTCVLSTLCSPTGKTDCCKRSGGAPTTTCCPGWTCP